MGRGYLYCIFLIINGKLVILYLTCEIQILTAASMKMIGSHLGYSPIFQKAIIFFLLD
jgi:hypothetical protein